MGRYVPVAWCGEEIVVFSPTMNTVRERVSCVPLSRVTPCAGVDSGVASVRGYHHMGFLCETPFCCDVWQSPKPLCEDGPTTVMRVRALCEASQLPLCARGCVSDRLRLCVLLFLIRVRCFRAVRVCDSHVNGRG